MIAFWYILKLTVEHTMVRNLKKHKQPSKLDETLKCLWPLLLLECVEEIFSLIARCFYIFIPKQFICNTFIYRRCSFIGRQTTLIYFCSHIKRSPFHIHSGMLSLLRCLKKRWTHTNKQNKASLRGEVEKLREGERERQATTKISVCRGKKHTGVY